MTDKKITIIVSLIFCAITVQNYAQSSAKNNSNSTLGPNDFPELIQTNIPDAPKLGRPQLIMGDTLPVRAEGRGWVAPAVYDWNGDGKKDLLIGEFGSGEEHGRGALGNFIRVYKNVGSNENPKFKDDFKYAKEIQNLKESTGTPLSIYTTCCLPFTPRFVDLDNDGFTDLLTGQYTPGYMTWFRGSKRGFLPGVKLEEAYDPMRDWDQSNAYADTFPITDPKGNAYWMFSSADLGDFDNDGDQDIIFGSTGGALRFCENIGTKTTPRFGKRKPLFDVKGNYLKTNTTASSVPYVVDWDGDGVLDILMTNSFIVEGSWAVTYFRGLKSEDGLQFEEGIPLFKTKNNDKAFPGSWLHVCVTDWNSDGVKDLLIGASVAVRNGVFNHELSWGWEKNTGIVKKNPGYFPKKVKKMIALNARKFGKNAQKKSGLNDAEWKKKGYESSITEIQYGKGGFKNETLVHNGYVYVMLGEKSNHN